MSQNPDEERQNLMKELEKLINTYYVFQGKLNSAFEDFKNSTVTIINQLMLENQSLNVHLKALQDEKTKANVNIQPDSV